MPEPLAIKRQAVRNELSGIGMSAYLTALGDETAQNEILDEKISEAQAQLQLDLPIYLFEEIIKSRPLDEGLERGIDYTKLDDSYPFIRGDWTTHGRVRTYRKPIRSVQRVAIRYGQGNQILEAVDYPADWISFEGRPGIVNVIPIMGSVTYGAGSMILLPITGGPIKRDSLPTLLTVDYTAGFLPRDFDRDSDDPYDACPDYDVRPLLKVIRLMATVAMMATVERATGAGGGSISMFGLSESYQAGRFEQEINRYKAEIESIKNSFMMNNSAPLIFTIR